MPAPRFAIFCDFDGTIARRDVGYHMYHHFSNGENEKLIPEWKSGALSTRECMTIESGMVHTTPQEFYAYIDTHELDPTFAPFAARCREQELPLTVISDGLDLYIIRLFQKFEIPPLPLIANRGELIDGGLKVTFPYPDPHNTGGGVCKGDRIREFRQKHDPITVIFVGDGLSDIGAIDQTDLLFAKKDLARYCDRQNIPYNAFNSFAEVARELVARGVLKA